MDQAGPRSTQRLEQGPRVPGVTPQLLSGGEVRAAEAVSRLRLGMEWKGRLGLSADFSVLPLSLCITPVKLRHF